jgi:hypothetical protein
MHVYACKKEMKIMKNDNKIRENKIMIKEKQGIGGPHQGDSPSFKFVLILSDRGVLPWFPAFPSLFT